MANTETYILTVDRHTRIVGKGEDRVFERYSKGDPIELTRAEAQRLEGSIELPGASAKAEAERLTAEAERLQAEADAAQERADAASDEAENGPAEEPDEAAELEKLSRDDLNAQAADAGVEEPDKLPNKGEVVKAILATRSE